MKRSAADGLSPQTPDVNIMSGLHEDAEDTKTD